MFDFFLDDVPFGAVPQTAPPDPPGEPQGPGIDGKADLEEEAASTSTRQTPKTDLGSVMGNGLGSGWMSTFGTPDTF